MTSPTLPSLQIEKDTGLARARHEGLLIFGCGSFARDVHAAAAASDIPVAGFVVSSGAPTICNGLPVAPLDALPPDWRRRPLWIGVFNREAISDYARIIDACRAAGFATPLMPQQYYAALADHLGWRYWLADRTGYAAQRDALESVLGRLEDTDSKTYFADLLRFRLGHLATIPGVPVAGVQYFPDFLLAQTRDPLGFVDAGAYDGDTLAEAARSLPLREAWAFEPDGDSFTRLATRARSLRVPTVCVPCGVSLINGTLPFTSGQGEASRLSVDGDAHAPVVRLDDCLPHAQVGYLKLDVEGHELDALAGAEALIRRNRPFLAIAGYHRWDDLWRIPQWIASLGQDYRLRFRIHAHNGFDAVFYGY
ncbi:MAG: FkbM family methyltransferase [Thauera sp.]|jgi:FkbM family methyltransferase